MNAAKEPTDRLHQHGVATLSNADLCAIVGVPSMAAESFRTVYGAPAAEVAKSLGTTVSKVARMQAVLELGRRFHAEPVATKPRLDSPELVAAYLCPKYSAGANELFGVLALDSKHRVIAERVVCTGGRHAVAVTPADVFRAALPYGPRSVVVFHNHPSGDPYPSEEDKALTYRLSRAGEQLGITVVDHIVLGHGATFFSFKQGGLM